MSSFLVKDCTDCGSLEDAICSVDSVLAQYAKNGWQNITYLTNKCTSYIRVRELIYYRQVLENLKWNSCFYSPFSAQEIISRAQTVTYSERGIVRRQSFFPPITTTTTTTTTTSTTTTTTSSTTTSTTSSTTTSTTSSTTTTTTTP